MGETRWDGLIVDAQLATLTETGEAYGAIRDGALGWRDGRIVFAGARRDLPDDPFVLSDRVESAQGEWITPGLLRVNSTRCPSGSRISLALWTAGPPESW